MDGYIICEMKSMDDKIEGTIWNYDMVTQSKISKCGNLNPER